MGIDKIQMTDTPAGSYQVLILTTFVVERSVSIGDLVATELGLKSILKAYKTKIKTKFKTNIEINIFQLCFLKEDFFMSISLQASAAFLQTIFFGNTKNPTVEV